MDVREEIDQALAVTASPTDLLEYATEFTFASGAKIRRTASDDIKLGGWAVEVGPERFMYDDGEIDHLPRYRAFEELGFTGGEDDLKSDADWKSFLDLRQSYSRKMILPLDQAWRLAEKHGVMNRKPKIGESVVVRETGENGVVSEVWEGFTAHEVGRVFVKFSPEDDEPKGYALKDLILPA